MTMLQTLPSERLLTPTDLAELLAGYEEATERLQAAHRDLQAEVARLRTELTEKNAALARKSRLAALGQMAAGVAHEIRNPLGAIRLFAGMLLRDLADARHAGYVEQIQRAVVSMDRIVEEMLSLARTREPVLRPCPLDRILDAALESTQRELDERSILVRRESAWRVVVRAEPEQLRRAFVNVITNAAQAMAHRGRLRIAVEPGTASDVRTSSVAPRAVEVRFTDTGPGIPPEHLERVFEPFFTGREDGTGLGLALVHRIVEGHGGRVWARNERTGGATFTIALPCCEEDLEDERDAA
jgi:signal transduction histidine kinase